MAEKRSCYSEEMLKEAVRLVNDEGFSFGESQQATGIPKSTIHKYAKATVIQKMKPGRTTILTEEEEKLKTGKEGKR